jgi:hypothetical protein
VHLAAAQGSHRPGRRPRLHRNLWRHGLQLEALRPVRRRDPVALRAGLAPAAPSL